MPIHPIHQSPEEKMSGNTERTVSAIEKNTEKVEENTRAIKDLHETQKDNGDTLAGFTGVVKAVRQNTEITDSLREDINNPHKTIQKLDEIKSAHLITNQELKKISKKEAPPFPEFPKEMEVSIKGIKTITLKGDDGKTPTDAELTALIRPLIPKPKDGHSPTKEEVLEIIKPYIPKVKDGKNPTNEELISLIKPLIPKVKDGKDGEDGSPDTPDEIIEKVNSAKKKILWKQIKGAPDFALQDTMNQMGVVAGGGPTYVWMDDAVRVSDHVREINFGSGLSVSYSNGRITVTGTGGGGANVATEKLTPTVSGSDITLDLTGLANTFSTIQWVAKNGQILDSSDGTYGWNRVANTITVLNGTVQDYFLLHYTYA